MVYLPYIYINNEGVKTHLTLLSIMDEITSLLNSRASVSSIISILKNKSIIVPAWNKLIDDYEPTKHEIVTDTISRKDRIRKDGVKEEASRIYIGLEKLLVKRMTEFMFAINVKRIYHNIEGSETRQQISKAIESIYKYARIDAENIRRGIAYFASCEFFTMWYAVEKPNNLYGFKSKYKLKCKTYSPMDGVSLYPLFDELGDMIAMSFEYKRTIRDKDVTYFETYTANKHYKWKQEDEGWRTLVDGENMILMKIPGIYGYRSQPIYHGLTYIRKDIEYTLSRNSDVIAYNASPVLKVSGKMVGEEDKGESRRLFRMEAGGDVSYVSWSQANEAVKYHIDTLLRLYWMQAQIPDISFDNLAGLGNIGFDARKTILTDAHLKVGDESGAWIELFDREANIVKEFLKLLNTSWAKEIDNIEVENIITPYIQEDENASIDKAIKANGGKPILSQLESIQMAGISKDPQATLEQIQKEESESATNSIKNIFGEGAE